MSVEQARQEFNRSISQGDEEASQSIKNRTNPFNPEEELEEPAIGLMNSEDDFRVSNSFTGESLYNFSAKTGQTKVKPKLDGVEAQAIFDLVNSHEGAMVNNGANLLVTSGGKKLFETDENGMVTFSIAQHDQNFSRRQSPISNSMEQLKGAMQGYGAVEGRTKSDLEIGSTSPTKGSIVGKSSPGNSTPGASAPGNSTVAPAQAAAPMTSLLGTDKAKASITRQELNILGKYYQSSEYKASNPEVNIKNKTDTVDNYKSAHLAELRIKTDNPNLSIQIINQMNPSPEAEITMKNEDIQNIEQAQEWQKTNMKKSTPEPQANTGMQI